MAGPSLFAVSGESPVGNPVQNYCFFSEGLWWFSPLLTSTCNYLPNLFRREVKMVADHLVRIHKGYMAGDG